MKNLHTIALIGTTFGAAFISSNSAGSINATEQEDFRDRNECVFIGQISDFKALDSQNLIIWTPLKKNAYLVTLSRACFGLRHTEALGIQSRDGRLCPYGGDAIVLRGFGGHPERCTIMSIQKWAPPKAVLPAEQQD